MRPKLICVLLLIAFTTPLPAQTSSGSLRGIVQDSTRARVANATIQIRLSNSSLTRTITSDAQGEFLIEDLTPGSWQVTVDAHGFSTAAAQVSVAVSIIRYLTVTMQPSQVRQTVGVAAQSSSIATQPIDLTSNVHQSIVTTEDLEGMPLPARSFANIAYLAPGTEPVEPSDPTKARITAVSTGGSSGLNNELSVDGGDNSDDYIGGFLQNFSPTLSRNSPSAPPRKTLTPEAPPPAPSSSPPRVAPTTCTALLRSLNGRRT